MFDKRVVKRLEESVDEFNLTYSFMNLEDDGIHGPNVDLERRSLCEELVGLLSCLELPSYIRGNFNVTYFSSEKLATSLPLRGSILILFWNRSL